MSEHSAGLPEPELDMFELEQQQQNLLRSMFNIELEPTRLADYVILEELGRGGMGVVYAAYDRRLDRKVALKRLRAQASADAQARLLSEAQAMAKLAHPNVVQVYEIDEVGGVAFLVMEYVEGQTLREWLDAEPRTQKQILAAFGAAGRGLIAAHDEGMIHRDFKPDNVMVRKDGRVLVMDFGLAWGELEPAESLEGREVNAPLVSRHALAGTPVYMAPEQFLGRELTPKLDQFAFCVALWEALGGARPFEERSLPALVRAVTRNELREPPRPIPVWIRAVLERGLEVDAAGRYASMGELLLELRRDPSRRRRRGLALGAGVLGLGGAVAAAALVLQTPPPLNLRPVCEAEGAVISRDWNEEVAARLERAFLATDDPLAPTAWSFTRVTLERYALEWSRRASGVCLDARVEGQLQAETYASVRACLDQRRASFGAFIDRLSTPSIDRLRQLPDLSSLPPLLVCESATLREHWAPPGVAQDELEAIRRALVAFPLSIEDADELYGRAEQLAWRPLIAEAELARALSLLQGERELERSRGHALAALHHAVASGDEFIAMRGALSLARADLQLAHYDAAEDWTGIGASYVEHLGLQGSAYEISVLQIQGQLARKRSDYGRAEQRLERARELLLASGEAPEQLDLAAVLEELGTTNAERGELERAGELYREALELYERRLGPSSWRVAHVYNSLGNVLLNQDQLDEALGCYERAVELRSEQSAASPTLALYLNNLGVAQGRLGAEQEAFAAHRRALEINQEQYGDEHPRTAGTLRNIGMLHAQRGELDKAEELVARALELELDSFGPDHSYLAFTHHDLGEVFAARGDYARALEQHERALDIRLGALGPSSSLVLDSLALLVHTARSSGEVMLEQRASARVDELRPQLEPLGLAAALARLE